MAFAWEYRRFASLEEFEQYVNGLHTTSISWVRGITIHHTYIPTLALWKKRGDEVSMNGLAKYYRDDVDDGAGWPAGPHLFITDTAILQGTPLYTVGVHGVMCNNKWGIEVVGDYNRVPWSPGTDHMVIGATAILAKKARMNPLAKTPSGHYVIEGHRDCNSPKTCPGSAISMTVVRQNVARTMKMVQPVAPVHVNGIEKLLVVGVARQSATYQQWRQYLINNGVTTDMLSEPEMQRVYNLCEDLNLDAAFLSAVWKQEGFVDNPEDEFEGKPVIGGSELQRASHNPINMRAADGEQRATVTYNGVKWLQSMSWQLGLMQAIIHLKNEYADRRGLLHVEDIIPVLAGTKPGTDSATYIANVRKRISDQRALAFT
jgi:hypothetical protein